MIVRVVPPHMSESLEVPVRDASAATPALLSEFLQHEGALPPEEKARPYVFFSDAGKTLIPNRSLAEQGIGAQSTIRIEREGTAAALSPREIASRRAHDHRVMCTSFPQGGAVVRGWTGYASAAHAERGRECRDGARVAVYDVTLRVRSPVGPGRYASSWRVRFDASDRSYPATAPAVTVLTSPRPWNPHTSPAGPVCLGTVWDSSKLLAHLVVGMVRLLNWDEDPGKLRFDRPHYNPDSIGWWMSAHGGRPIDAALLYPAVGAAASAPSPFAAFGAIRRG